MSSMMWTGSVRAVHDSAIATAWALPDAGPDRRHATSSADILSMLEIVLPVGLGFATDAGGRSVRRKVVASAFRRRIVTPKPEVPTMTDVPKSALDIVMERLRRKDAEAGTAQQTLTDAQRAAIADVRSIYE